jgi:hypothetical protein
LNKDSSIINLRVAILAIIMVIWGVAEFALHTLRPDTIQRENRIVTVFRQASEAILASHQDLQLKASHAAVSIQNTLSDNPDQPIGHILQQLSDRSQHWILIRDQKAVWWSEQLTMSMIHALMDSESALFTDDQGMYVTVSTTWNMHGALWQLAGGQQLFAIANKDSRYGDVYQANTRELHSLKPTPYYLEGSPDLLPFDHRFSIIRLRDDATTGHLALSTLDPDVRNYVDPFWNYLIRSIMFSFIAFLTWNITSQASFEYPERTKLAIKLSLIALFGFVAVLLDLVQYWTIGVYTFNPILYHISLSDVTVMGWIGFVSIPASAVLFGYLQRIRMFDHSLRFNRTTLIIFSVGMMFALGYWWSMKFALTIADLHADDFKTMATSGSSIIWIVQSLCMAALSYAVLKFILRSVKYQAVWVVQLLLFGYTYLYTILLIVNYTQNDPTIWLTLWIGTMFPVVIWITWTWIKWMEETHVGTLIQQSSLLSVMPTLTLSGITLYLFGGDNTLSQLFLMIVIIYVLSWILSVVILWFFYTFSGVSIRMINIDASIWASRSDYRTIFVIVGILLTFISSHYISHYLSSSQLEQQFIRFDIQSGSQYRVSGSYGPGLLGLPTYQNWTLNETLPPPEIMSFSTFTSVQRNNDANILRWNHTANPKSRILDVFKPASPSTSESFNILFTTINSYGRIFESLSSTISSSIIFALLCLHLTIRMVGKRRLAVHVKTTEEP